MFRQSFFATAFAACTVLLVSALPADAAGTPLRKGAAEGLSHLCYELMMAYARNPAPVPDAFDAGKAYWDRVLQTAENNTATREEYRTAMARIGSGLLRSSTENPTVVVTLTQIADGCVIALQTGTLPDLGLEQ